MKKGVWTIAIFLLLFTSSVFSDKETVDSLTPNAIRVSMAPVHIDRVGALVRTFDITDQTLLNIQTKFNSYQANPSQGLYLTPKEAKAFYEKIGNPKTWLGTPIIGYEQQQDGKWKKIKPDDIKSSNEQSYLLPGSASPGINYYTTSYYNQGVVC